MPALDQELEIVYIPAQDFTPTIICGQQGSGKTVFMERIAQTYHKLGYTVISVYDAKDDIEAGFCIFPITRRYHLNALQEQHEQPEQIPIKLYHPAILKMPKNVRKRYAKIPPINFYTIPLKSLSEPEIAYINESEIEQLKNHSKFMLNMIKSCQNKGITYFRYHCWKNNRKLYKKVKQNLDPFKEYPFITGTHPTNLNIRELINDNKNYHIFIKKWIQDEKLGKFQTLWLIHQIFENSDSMKHPVCIISDEFAHLVPPRAKGYIAAMSSYLRKTLQLARRKRVLILTTSQKLCGLDEKAGFYIVNKYTGGTTFPDELRFFEEKFSIKSEMKKKLMSLPKGQFLEISDIGRHQDIYGYYGGAVAKLPTHAHAEPGQKFFKMYKKSFPDKRVETQKLLEPFVNYVKEERIEARALFNKRRQELQDEHARSESQEEKVQELTQKVKVAQEQQKSESKQKKSQRNEALTKVTQEHPDWSYQQISDYLRTIGINISPATITRIRKEENDGKQPE